MPSDLLAVAPVVLGNAVRPPLNLLTALIGLVGLGLGSWLIWMGVSFDRSGAAPLAPSDRPTRRAPSEPGPAPDRKKAIV